MNQKLMDIAERIIASCRQNNIHVLRYDALSTNSIYLKFDYGVLNSLRISDHKGKRHLKYRYNITLGDIPRESRRGWPRHYYSTSDQSVDDCMEQILRDRTDKIGKYGLEGYRRFMEQDKREKSGNKGFWAQAIEVS